MRLNRNYLSSAGFTTEGVSSMTTLRSVGGEHPGGGRRGTEGGGGGGTYKRRDARERTAW